MWMVMVMVCPAQRQLCKILSLKLIKKQPGAHSHPHGLESGLIKMPKGAQGLGFGVGVFEVEVEARWLGPAFGGSSLSTLRGQTKANK